jgi:hypothetical protein
VVVAAERGGVDPGELELGPGCWDCVSDGEEEGGQRKRGGGQWDEEAKDMGGGGGGGRWCYRSVCQPMRLR